MQRMKSLALVLVTLFGVFALAAAPVAADSGSGDTSGSDSTSQSSDTSSTDSTSSDTQTTETESTTETQDVKDAVERFRQDAKDELKQMREQEHSSLTEHGRQLACEKRQASINNRISNYADAAQRHLGVFTDIFTKVKSFYATKNLSVSNYDTLVAAVTAKQTAAQTAVDALKALDVKIDCTQTDPAQTLAAVKSAVSDARTALQAYRTSIKDLIVAISSALDQQTQSTGGNQ